MLIGQDNGGLTPTDPDLGTVDPDPVSEEIVWKSRALEAEEKLEACEARIQELTSELSTARDALASVERRREIERELSGASAVDMETALMLTEAAIGEIDEPDVSLAVRELRARKPFLFGQSSEHGVSSAMAGRIESARAELDDLALRARDSGDRAELLRYLRARRRG